MGRDRGLAHETSSREALPLPISVVSPSAHSLASPTQAPGFAPGSELLRQRSRMYTDGHLLTPSPAFDTVAISLLETVLPQLARPFPQVP